MQLAAAVLALGLALGSPGVLPAHNYIIESTPASGQTLTALPAQFSLTTDEDLLDIDGSSRGFAMLIQDAGGRYYGDGCVAVKGPSMSTAAAVGAPGDYTVVYQYVSADGHVLSGTIPFHWAGADSGVVGAASPPSCPGSGYTVAPVAGGSATSAAPTIPADALWIAGAVIAVLAGVGLGVLIVSLRRRT